MPESKFNLKVIGYVKNGIEDPEFEVWDEVTSVIYLVPELVDGLVGLEEFSHVVVVYILSRSRFDLREDLVKHPFDDPMLPKVGVFARRAKERPNALGITTATVLRVETGRLIVQGLDALDGSPVVDLKGFDPGYDTVWDPVVPMWLRQRCDGKAESVEEEGRFV
jgi:tRNA (adenine37-N6)-methyltransferase